MVVPSGARCGRSVDPSSGREDDMVLVDFTNGESAAMPAGTHVKAEPFAKDGPDSAAHPGITCLDVEGREVGRFRVAEIIGYVIAGGADADDRDGQTAEAFDHADILTGADWPP
jgi:hypothetical protein